MKYGCIGEHLAHSFSKEIHAKLADYEYEIREVAKSELDSFMKTRDFAAINVTIPYKEAVMSYLDFVSETAEKIGAVNTVVNMGGRLYGYNTDFHGMTALIKRTGIQFSNKKVLILGTGGTSKTAAAVAGSLGAAQILKVSRTGRNGALTYGDAYEKHADADIIVNTTPCGMYPYADAAPVDLSHFPRLCGVIDAVYNPLRTELYFQAKSLGITAECGLYMLVSQAAQAVALFTGRPVGEDETERVYESMIREKENIVLIGMPGSGKSTVGKLIASRLGRQFVDTDDVVLAMTGRTPDEIIRSDGECRFREIESEAIAKVAAPLTSAVIATGGGAVLTDDNVRRLKRNGRLVLLDRPIGEIEPTPSRPLSSTKEQLIALYRERMKIYSAVAELRVPISADAEKSADAVISLLERGE